MKRGAVGLWEASLRGGAAAAVDLIGCPLAVVAADTTCRAGETMMTSAHAGAHLHHREEEEEDLVLHEIWDPHTTGEVMTSITALSVATWMSGGMVNGEDVMTVTEAA